jgi:hypothetical protein
MCLLSQLLRRGKKEDHGLAQSLQKWDPIWKITKLKKAGGMTCVVGHLPSKFKSRLVPLENKKQTKVPLQWTNKNSQQS